MIARRDFIGEVKPGRPKKESRVVRFQRAGSADLGPLYLSKARGIGKTGGVLAAVS